MARGTGGVGGNSFAGRGNSNASGGAGNRNRNRGNRRPDTGYGAPRIKKSLLNNKTASFYDLIEPQQNKGEEEEEVIYDYYL